MPLDRISEFTQTGRLGELLAMYHLERQGVQTHRVDREEVDLWVRTPSGRLRTVQVKAASAPISDRGRPPAYRFWIPKTGTVADLVALVALDREVVVIFPSTTRGLRSRHFSAFTREAMDASIKEHLA